jgi:(2Fe-2S) ferredoxin
MTVEKPRIQDYRRHLLVCVGPRCTQGESQRLFDGLGEKLKAAGLDQGALRVKRTRVHCFAACRGGPVMCVQPDGIWYYNVTPQNMDRIIAEHLSGGRPVEELIFHRGPGTQEVCSAMTGERGAADGIAGRAGQQVE